MKKLFSLLLAAAMLLALCVTAFADSPAEADKPAREEPVQTGSAAKPVQYALNYDLDVNESVECSGFHGYYFYGYYTAGTEISVRTSCTPGSKVTIHFWSDSGSSCSTVVYNEKDGGVVLPGSGYWHAEVIANYNDPCKGTILLTVDP